MSTQCPYPLTTCMNVSKLDVFPLLHFTISCQSVLTPLSSSLFAVSISTTKSFSLSNFSLTINYGTYIPTLHHVVSASVYFVPITCTSYGGFTPQCLSIHLAHLFTISFAIDYPKCHPNPHPILPFVPNIHLPLSLPLICHPLFNVLCFLVSLSYITACISHTASILPTLFTPHATCISQLIHIVITLLHNIPGLGSSQLPPTLI